MLKRMELNRTNRKPTLNYNFLVAIVIFLVLGNKFRFAKNATLTQTTNLKFHVKMPNLITNTNNNFISFRLQSYIFYVFLIQY